MGDKRRRYCVTCGGHSSVVGEISWEGNCHVCGQTNLIENIYGLATKTGMPYRRWLRGLERYVQRERLDITGERP